MHFLGFLLLLIYVKGLGGSFHSLLGQWNGPVIGLVLGGLFASYFLSFPGSPAPRTSLPLGARRGFVVLSGIMLFAAMSVRVALILKTPLDPSRADMLPAVQTQIAALLSGNNPFAPLTMADGRPLLHGYLPALWLYYLPLRWLEFDIRWMNVFSQWVIYTFFCSLFLSRKTYAWGSFKKSSFLFLVALGLLLFSKESLKQAVDVHTAGYGLFFSLFLWAFYKKRWAWAGVFCGLFLQCREPALFLVLPLAVFLFWKKRTVFWKMAVPAAISVLLISMPFILWSPSYFFSGIQFYSRHIYDQSLEDMLLFYGFSGVLKMMGIVHWQKGFQLLGLGIATAVFWKRRKEMDAYQALALGGVAYLFLMQFASLSYQFVYVELMILASFLFLIEPPEVDRVRESY